MEIIILLILSLFAFGKKTGVTFERGGPADASGTLYGGSSRGGAETGPGAGWVKTQVLPGENMEIKEGLAGDPAGKAEKLDEEADDSFLIWAKDRFPPKLRVHLAPTNIRDVMH